MAETIILIALWGSIFLIIVLRVPRLFKATKLLVNHYGLQALRRIHTEELNEPLNLSSIDITRISNLALEKHRTAYPDFFDRDFSRNRIPPQIVKDTNKISIKLACRTCYTVSVYTHKGKSFLKVKRNIALPHNFAGGGRGGLGHGALFGLLFLIPLSIFIFTCIFFADLQGRGYFLTQEILADSDRTKSVWKRIEPGE